MTDIFLSEGGNKYPALKFENVNDTYSGTVIEVKKLEDRSPDGTVKTWDTGGKILVVDLPSAYFSIGENLVGTNSGATGSVQSATNVYI